MAELLLHSLAEFAEIILTGLDIADAADVVEIGAEFGGMTQLLADRAARRGATLTSIDPAPMPAFLDWVATQPEVRHLAQTSLTALPRLDAADAWVIDGDHNLHTVYHELSAIREISRRDGRPMLAFLHDIHWPCGRRDMYYAPDQIPAAHRQPYDYDGGAVPGTSALVPSRGFRGMGRFAYAKHEGGPRNGVMTAIEDFIGELHAQGEDMAFAEVPAVFGLGVLFDMDASWSEALGAHLLPYHGNGLLRALERNRLDNYLRVLDYQDAAAAA